MLWSSGSLNPHRSYRRDAVALVGVLLLTAVALRVFYGPAAFDFRLPWIYDTNDGLSHAMIVKSIIHSGAFLWRNKLIGAPFGTEWFDYPLGEYANFLLVKSIALFSSDWVVVMNAFVVLGYFLAAGAGYLVLREIGLAPVWAGTGALLFAFLPYHHVRAAQLGHLFLAAYYAIPLAVWLALKAWAAGDVHGWRSRAGVGLAVVAIVVGSSGVYYAFFACMLVAAAGAAAAVAQRSARAARTALAIIAIVGVTIVANLAPSLAHSLANGRNPEVGLRNPAEAERYGLKVTQMLLPAPDHRWAPARAVSEQYLGNSPLANENRASALGIAGGLGLLVLAGVAFGRLAGTRGTYGLLDKLALLTMTMVLVGTVGGFGSLFAWTVSPSIRAYNRVSIFIGFMSLAALLIVLQQATLRWRAAGRAPWLAIVPACLLGFAGLWDQTTPIDRVRIAAPFADDRSFVQRVEHRLPKGSLLYQLPYRPYPEIGPLHRMEDYDLFRGYLHSDQLRWSYGAMRGREGDAWYRALAARPLDEQLDQAGAKGAGAVYLERRGYADRGAAMAAALRARLGEPVATSGDGDRAVYLLPATRQAAAARIRESLSQPMDFAKSALPPNVLRIEGISEAEPWGRWTDGRIARIRLAGALPEKFTLELVVWTVYGPNSNQPVKVRVDGQERSFTVSEAPATIRLDFALSSAADVIELELPKPMSPRERGESADTRALGIGLKSLRILPAP